MNLYIEPHEPKGKVSKFRFIESVAYAPFFKSYKEKGNLNASRTFMLTELKIKCREKTYYFLSGSTWLPIQGNDIFIVDKHKVRIDLISEPLPFEGNHPLILNSNTNQSYPAYEDIAPSKDPLTFLYNTPAQEIGEILPKSKGYLSQKEGDLAITWLEVIQNRQQQQTSNFLLLSADSLEIEEVANKKDFKNE